MANFVRWDPYREMWSLRRAMDRMFDAAVTDGSQEWEMQRWELPVDVIEQQDAFTVKASLPGAKPEDLEITYDKGVLTIQAETHSEEERKEDRYLVRERRSGRFVRSLALPTSINADHIEASFEGGILTLRLPKTDEVKPRRIQVQGANRPMIEGVNTN